MGGERVPFRIRDLPCLVKENPEVLPSSNFSVWRPQKNTWTNTSPSSTSENKRSKSHIVWVAGKKKMDGLVIRFLLPSLARASHQTGSKTVRRLTLGLVYTGQFPSSRGMLSMWFSEKWYVSQSLGARRMAN